MINIQVDDEFIDQLAINIASRLELNKDAEKAYRQEVERYEELNRNLMKNPNLFIFSEQFFILGEDVFRVNIQEGKAKLSKLNYSRDYSLLATEISREDYLKRKGT